MQRRQISSVSKKRGRKMTAWNALGAVLQPEIQNEFSLPWHGGDVVFVVEGRQLHCNKGVLVTVSPMFKAMFELDFKEKSAPEVPLPEKKYEDMVEFFRCIHPHINKDVTSKTVETLLRLADEYECEMLTRKCRSFLAASLEQCRTKTAMKKSQSYISDFPGDAVLRWLKLTDQFLQEPELVKGLVEELQCRMTAEQLTRTDDYKALKLEVMHLLFHRYTSKMDEEIGNFRRELSSRDAKINVLEQALKRK